MTETVRLAGKTPGNEAENAAKVGLGLLIRSRWIAILGQLTLIIGVHYGLGHILPLWPALWLIIASLLLNLACVSQQRQIRELDNRTLLGLLIFDVIQLSALLYLTGGMSNPFAILLLAPVVLAATVLPMRLVMWLVSGMIVAMTVITLYHQPIPWKPPGMVMPALYLVGCWMSMVMASFFICIVVSLIQRRNDKITRALIVTQMALAREQRMSALGALAAAAAHELGSPLATLRLVATEMARELPADHPLAEDIHLMVQETGRCRDILAELARHPDQEAVQHPHNHATLAQILVQALSPHTLPHLTVDIDNLLPEEWRDYPILITPELLHGLGNLLQNACQFARRHVTITLTAEADTIRIIIQDDGPGFSHHILHRLGEPYVSGRGDSNGGNLGLGVFIARTLLERTGADIMFEQRDNEGATQVIRWSWDKFMMLTHQIA